MKRFCQLLIAVILVSSCSTHTADPDGIVGSDIKLILREEISEEGRNLEIRSETLEVYSCYNYSIVTTRNFQNDAIVISYSGISKPQICLTAIGPAISLEFFSLQKGIYPITFVNDGVSNEGQLTVDDEKYILIIKDPKNVFVEKEVLNKS